jgi:hypothetical protein
MATNSPQTLVEIIGSGSEVVLDNGARYTIRPEHQARLAAWHPPQRVVVKRTPGSDYPFEIKNVDLGGAQPVAAKVSSLD